MSKSRVSFLLSWQFSCSDHVGNDRWMKEGQARSTFWPADANGQDWWYPPIDARIMTCPVVSPNDESPFGRGHVAGPNNREVDLP